MRFEDLGIVSDVPPSEVPSLSPWQSPDSKDNITLDQALKVKALFPLLSPNFSLGRTAVAPNLSGGPATAPFIPIEISKFPADARLYYQSELAVAGKGWIILDLGETIAKLNTRSSEPTAILTGIINDVYGKMNAQGIDLSQTREQMLLGIQGVEGAAVSICTEFVDTYKA